MFPKTAATGWSSLKSYIWEYLYVICTHFGVLVVNKPSKLNEITNHKKSKRVKMDTTSSTYVSVNNLPNYTASNNSRRESSLRIC